MPHKCPEEGIGVIKLHDSFAGMEYTRQIANDIPYIVSIWSTL